MDLSIIIVSYNTVLITLDCICSIKSLETKLQYEIILVDNNSSDDSVELIARKFPEVKIVANKTNNWFAKANNQGAEIAQGKCLLLLNSDTLVEKDNIDELYQFLMSSKENVVCVGPVVLNKDRTLQSQGYALPSLWERMTMCFKLHKFLPSLLAKKILPLGTPNVIRESHQVGWISGCCMMVKSEMYRKVSGLNENMEFYGEEPEFGYRLKQMGYETWLVSSAYIIHLGGMSTKKEKEKTQEQEEASLWRYAQLQKYTVGYRRAIWMSRVVLFAGYVKLLISSNKNYFRSSIDYEKKVIQYLKSCL